MRIHALLLASGILIQATCAETIYFLLRGFPGSGTAVIPLSRPEHIAHARDLIVRGGQVDGEPNQPILGVRVRAGRDGINRNYEDPRLPVWSWHVYEVIRFADVALEPSAETPFTLEGKISVDPATWDEKRPVSFPLFMIVRELGPSPIYLSTFLEGDRLQFYWSTLSTNAAPSVLESTGSLTELDWQPVPGSWPVTTNHWTLDRLEATNQFYRVRTELPQPASSP